MEDIDISKVKSFLAGHDYIVKVHKTGEDECKATFPHPKIIKPISDQDIINYKIRRDGEPGIFVNGEFWSAPHYALRLMITCDIISRMKKIPIHESLISYHNEEDKEVERVMDLINPPESEEDRKKEGFLAGLIWKAIEDKFTPMYEEVANTREHNVGTGYRLLKSFF